MTNVTNGGGSGDPSEAVPDISTPRGSQFLASQKVFFNEKFLGGKSLWPDLETPIFNSSESVFWVKKSVGGGV